MKINLSFLSNFFAPVKTFFVEHRKVGFILLGLVALGYVAGLFYLYAWRVKPAGTQKREQTAIDAGLYDKVMKNLQDREANFNQEASKTYPNPFK